MPTDERMEIGTFYNRHDADQAVQMLHDLGYNDDEISVMMNDEVRQREFGGQTGTKAAEGATTGGVVGGVAGGTLAGIFATGAIVTIASGGLLAPIVIGPIAAILAGIGAGGIVGGVVGALVGAGIPERTARDVEASLQKGAIVIAVRPHASDRERVVSALAIMPRRAETGEILTDEPEEPTEFTPESVRHSNR